jgi:hypothetical protein
MPKLGESSLLVKMIISLLTISFLPSMVAAEPKVIAQTIPEITKPLPNEEIDDVDVTRRDYTVAESPVPALEPSKLRSQMPSPVTNSQVKPSQPNANTVNDGLFPSTDSNPTTDPKGLTQRGDREADFELLKGDLPCLDSSLSCIKLLSELAIANSRTLKGLDLQISQNQDNAKEVAKAGEGNILNLVQPFSPILVPFIGLGGAIAGVLNNLAGNSRTDQSIAQSNTTIAIRISEIERNKLVIRDKIEDSVVQELVVFDNLRVQADISVAIANRESSRFKLIEVGYRLGEGDTNSFISLQNNLDRTRVQVTKDKAALRIQAAKIKRIVGDER